MDSLYKRLAQSRKEEEELTQQIATLDRMRYGGDLTRCPSFLQDNTTIRALQRLMREAKNEPMLWRRKGSKLQTAAAVARERIRAKLRVLQEQKAESLKILRVRIANLREQARAKAREAEKQHVRVMAFLNTVSKRQSNGERQNRALVATGPQHAPPRPREER